jgi:hypothetical protein
MFCLLVNWLNIQENQPYDCRFAQILHLKYIIFLKNNNFEVFGRKFMKRTVLQARQAVAKYHSPIC